MTKIIKAASASADSITTTCAKVIVSFTQSEASIVKAYAAHELAKRGQLEMLASALNGVDPVTEEAFENMWRVPLLSEATKAGIKDPGVKIAGLKVAIIALTNNIKPLDTETTLSKFVTGARQRASSAGVYKLKATGRPSDTSKPKAPVVHDARVQAVRLIAHVPGDVVASDTRADALLFLTNACWPELLALAERMLATRPDLAEDHHELIAA